MAYQEQKTTGYGTRVGNSFKAIGTGFILFCIGTALLWWNEGRTVKTEKMLEEVGGAYVEMENPNKKDASSPSLLYGLHSTKGVLFQYRTG